MLGNDDDVMVSGLPVGNSYESFQCMVHEIWIFKEKRVFILYFLVLIKARKGFIYNIICTRVPKNSI